MWNEFGGGGGDPEGGAASPRPRPARPSHGPAGGQAPWHGRPDGPACTAAFFNLFNALEGRLAIRGRLHAQTCLAAIGAIAGFAAQRFLFEDPSNAHLLESIRTARTRSGFEYYAGEPLNRMLVPAAGARADGELWPLAAAGAVQAGLPPGYLPDPGEMFAHVATSLASGAEGWPSVNSDQQPYLNGRDTLQIVWPVALDCFTGQVYQQRGAEGVAIRRWPVIAGRLAGTLIERTARVVDPRTALILVMESAIYASKVQRETAGAVAAE